VPDQSFLSQLKRVMVGARIPSHEALHERLSRVTGLAVLSSDALSSVAYATEEILRVLLVGGLAAMSLVTPIGVVIAVTLAVVVFSYRQTIYAYPSGGGAYIVAKENLGTLPSLVAASSLLIDYVLTVAVSVVAGVAAITSAIPSLAPHAVAISLACVVLLTVVNLRGVRESGRVFAIPTYGFVIAISAMLLIGFGKVVFGDGLTAESAHYQLRQTAETGGLLTVFLCLRAFASGCTALTGVEAISNGVPAFQAPKSQNAARTLVAMGALAVTMFAGITALALLSHVHMAEDTSALIGFHGEQQKTALSQIGVATFGTTLPFYLLQAFTAAILVLAANTAFNGFPVLASLLGRDGYLPHQLAHRGDRLVFSNGILILAGIAGVLIVAFDAQVNRLIQLYILGVFLSFTLSQSGMVRHWQRELRAEAVSESGRRDLRVKQAVNATGAVVTGLVLVIVLITKFAHGAWIVVLAAPLLFALMKTIASHYRHVERELAPGASGVVLPARIHAVVLVSKLNVPTLRALAFAQATAPATLVALKVSADDADDPLPTAWEERGVPVKLVLLESPYRETVRPVLRYVRQLRREQPGDVISVIIPEYVVRQWWQHLLHNQTALRLKAQFYFEPAVTVTSVPWLLDTPAGGAATAFGQPVTGAAESAVQPVGAGEP